MKQVSRDHITPVVHALERLLETDEASFNAIWDVVFEWHKMLRACLSDTQALNRSEALSQQLKPALDELEQKLAYMTHETDSVLTGIAKNNG
ncbi:MAG: hypothetical protein JW850_12215 [Thermoflexales bacterium]|nr:hypothetical protein [Thermoflexales bacterium]